MGDGPVTPEATIGPFYPGAFLTHTPADLWTVAPLVAHHPQGQPIVVAARFFDSLRRPVPSLVVEFWQANAHGRYRHPEDRSSAPLDPQFDGFARLRTGDDGALRLQTIKPGAHPVPVGSGLSVVGSGSSRTNTHSAVVRAPHLRLTIFASGIDRLVTQIFFDDEPLNATDPVLTSIPDSVVRSRLVAARCGQSGEAIEYAIDIVMRGDGETPFFDAGD